MEHLNSGSAQGVRGGRLVLAWAVACGVLLVAGGCHMFDEEPQQQVLIPQQGYPMYYCQPAYAPVNNCQPAVPLNRTSNTSGGIAPIPQPAPPATTGGATGGQAYQQRLP